MRPIDADGLKKSITDYHAGLFPRYISKLVDAEIEDIKDIIDEQITLDYAPVKHGEWKVFTLNRGDRQYVDSDLTCGVCSRRFVRLKGMKMFNCCPNCGAKMDGGKNDERY